MIFALAWFNLRADYYTDDSDGDGLFDYEEDLIGTSIWNPDSDYDGFGDGEEYWGGRLDQRIRGAFRPQPERQLKNMGIGEERFFLTEAMDS